MRQGLNRLWLVLVLAAFGFPLFIGLGSTDLANDEAIYSYAVESILTTGDWMSPRSSPNEDITFLEKPPLKFWIVAAPIHLGLLPYDEFGLRFWDALFGALAFAYVFLIGRRLAGPVCGLVAVLVLFAHKPLLFEHGLRSNNMDALLVLAYCGGVYHFLRWTSASPARLWHMGAVAGWFFLGFMAKFVAALFLPVVLAVSALVLPAQRRQLAQDWRRWVFVGAAAIALALPWFIYQYSVHGEVLWRVMFGEHVYTRFTTFADPAHVQPWHFYISAAYREFDMAGSTWWVGLGLAVLLVQAVRRRTIEWVVVAIWFILPVAIISTGSSKLYHYLYPYLPPLALAAGAGVAWIAEAAGSRLHLPDRFKWRTPMWVRGVAWGVTGLAIAVALATVINGATRLYAGDTLIFRNTSLVRPLLLAGVGIAVAAGLRAAAAVAAVLIVQLILPTPLTAYETNLRRLRVRHRPLATLAQCLREVDAGQSATPSPRGVYAPVSDAFLHPYFYYLRGAGWQSSAVDDQRLHSALRVPGEERPVAIDQGKYVDFVERTGPVTAPRAELRLQSIMVILPGPYAVCAKDMGGR